MLTRLLIYLGRSLAIGLLLINGCKSGNNHEKEIISFSNRSLPVGVNARIKTQLSGKFSRFGLQCWFCWDTRVRDPLYWFYVVEDPRGGFYLFADDRYINGPANENAANRYNQDVSVRVNQWNRIISLKNVQAAALGEQLSQMLAALVFFGPVVPLENSDHIPEMKPLYQPRDGVVGGMHCKLPREIVSGKLVYWDVDIDKHGNIVSYHRK